MVIFFIPKISTLTQIKNNRLNFIENNPEYFDIDELKCRHPQLYKEIVGFLEFPARMDLVDRILLADENQEEFEKISLEEKEERESEVIRLSKELFMMGKDHTFDYTRVDTIINHRQVDQDLEDLYFDSEEPNE